MNHTTLINSLALFLLLHLTTLTPQTHDTPTVYRVPTQATSIDNRTVIQQLLHIEDTADQCSTTAECRAYDQQLDTFLATHFTEEYPHSDSIPYETDRQLEIQFYLSHIKH